MDDRKPKSIFVYLKSGLHWILRKSFKVLWRMKYWDRIHDNVQRFTESQHNSGEKGP